MKKRQLLIAIGLAGLGLLSQGQALAQADYPNKPIKLIVAFPPGGTSDVMGRLMAEEVGKVLKQAIVVENIAGAGGIVGMERALKLPADGYTIIQTGVGQSAVAHGLDPNLKYNSLTDFIHLSQVNSGPNVLVVHPSQPFKTVKDIVDYAKKNPGKLDYGFTHAASGHMAMELFKQTAGVFLTHIPYRGTAPSVTDLIAGQVDATWEKAAESFINGLIRGFSGVGKDFQAMGTAKSGTTSTTLGNPISDALAAVISQCSRRTFLSATLR